MEKRRCAEGWLKYEARLIGRPGTRPPWDFPGPRWLGREDIAGQTILLHSERGFGDAMQFVRYGALGLQVWATAAPHARLAVDVRPRRHAVVSRHAAISAERGGGLGGCGGEGGCGTG